ncbi:class I SAM-dependent methyltransferase [Parafilimonas terrae]|uniref:2-polyprenyl-3-methyl-5-hydroxy-6-metoxy-1,4-benzoquinol methylase n=1 Tax=Parafilimonas terrae TaxID=1465490 RepID=A0A1I5YUD1_9BACT|nr:class I SAM-dependent methyltransferase [Parafilimonas terrae]SFQ47782.1 2-polyprenyl-3-methyl-5-hydroxy-6-metoxy-1,4-benzoquinol methylase [Parafilimonas terrae]
MSNTIHYNNCPACSGADIEFVLKAKDETVSHDYFEIWQCNNCTLRFTQDVPDEESIGRYYQSSEYISHSNTSKGMVNKLYHAVRSVTLQTKRKLVEKYSGIKGGNLLDIGAGTGAFAAAMKNAGWHVTGLEPDETARANAQKDFNIELQPTENLFNLNRESFDAITLWHVLEHVHRMHEYLDAFHTLLKPGGTLIIAVPNYTSYDAKIYNANWAAYDVPRHLYHFSPASMQKLLSAHQFTPAGNKPMWFDSFYVSLLSEKYTSGKSNFIKAFFNGLRSNRKALQNASNCSSVTYIAKK